MSDIAAFSQARAEHGKLPPQVAIVPRKRPPAQAPSRYGEWFYGEKVASRRLKPITNDMSAEDVATATRANLALIGEETRKRIVARLPAGHALHKAIRAAALRSAPHLGTCKFGEIVTDYDRDKYQLMQVFLANFAGHLDTSAPARFLVPLSKNYDQMFFGLHVEVDRAGNPLGFNRGLGIEGVAFQTRNLLKAFLHIASASTGVAIEEWEARARAGATGKR